MLLIAGDQVPVMLFVEIVGSAGILAPELYGPTCVKVGVVRGMLFIVTSEVEVQDALDIVQRST